MTRPRQALRAATLVAGVLLCALAAAAQAGAAVYCVGEPACPADGVEQGASGAALQAALEAARTHVNSGGPDVVLVGSGTYSRAGGFQYSGEPVVVRGAGTGLTRLTAPSASGGKAMLLDATEAGEPSLAHLRVTVPPSEDMYGLWMQAGRAEDVAIEAPEGASTATGLRIEGGTFSHGSIDAAEGTGIDDRGGEVLYSQIAGGGWGVQASSHATLRGDTIAGGTPLLSYYAEPLVVEDSLIEMGGASVGVRVVANTNGATDAMLRHVAIVGGGQRGLELDAEGKDAAATLEDSIVSEAEHPLVVSAAGGASAALSTAYSSYEAGKDTVIGSGATLAPANVPAATPDFVSPLSGDFRLAPGSPLIDAGTPGAPAAGELATDLAGNPRIVHGRRDVGPYEYQWRGPSVRGAAAKSTVEIGQPVSFTGSASALEAGDAVAGYQWTFDDGASVAAGASAVHAFSTPGPHTATLTATDVLGVSSAASVTVTATRLAVCAVAACVGGCDTAGKCVVVRAVHGLRVRPKAFHASARGGVTASRRGAKVSYTVSGGVSLVNFTIRRGAPGVVEAGGCLRRRRGVHGGKPCMLYARTITTFSRISPAGGNGFRLTGRARGRALAPGRYELIASPASSPAVGRATALFQVLR